MTERQNNIITGCLLGDGSLTKVFNNTNRNACFRVDHGKSQLDYLRWLHKELLPLSSEIKERIHKQGYLSYSFRTNRLPLFTQLENKWYLRNENKEYILNENNNHRIKQIPNDLQFNPLMLAVWFYDDGTNYPKKREAVLATHCFTYNECALLVDKFQQIGIKSFVNRVHSDHPIIRISSTSYLDFIKIISGQIDCKTMNYKITLEGYTAPYSKIGKLDNYKVKQIFVMKSQGLSQQRIAEIMEVSRSNISLILRRKSWSKV